MHGRVSSASTVPPATAGLVGRWREDAAARRALARWYRRRGNARRAGDLEWQADRFEAGADRLAAALRDGQLGVFVDILA